MRSIIHNFDAKATELVRRNPIWMDPIYRAATTIGHPGVILLVVAAIFVWEQASGQSSLALGAVGVAATIFLSTILKMIFRRVRPVNEYVDAMLIKTFSFPSGHAAGAMVGFGFFAYLACNALSSPYGLLVSVMCLLSIWLVGVSRVHLGAHYPSDVIAGWLVGLAGLLVIIYMVMPLS